MSEVIVVTSGKGGVGKTTTTANIGTGLAKLGKKVVMIDTDTGLRNLDVVLGNSGGFLNGAELGVNQKAELILGGIGNQGIADGTVIGLGIVAADPQIDPGQAVLGVLGQAEVRSFGSHGIDGGLEVGLLLSGQSLKGGLEHGGIIITGKHIQEVLAHDLGINIHE